jgi:hypothetical protein
MWKRVTTQRYGTEALELDAEREKGKNGRVQKRSVGSTLPLRVLLGGIVYREASIRTVAEMVVDPIQGLPARCGLGGEGRGKSKVNRMAKTPRTKSGFVFFRGKT